MPITALQNPGPRPPGWRKAWPGQSPVGPRAGEVVRLPTQKRIQSCKLYRRIRLPKHSLTRAEPLRSGHLTSGAEAPRQPCSRSPPRIERKKLPPPQNREERTAREGIELVAKLFCQGAATCPVYGCYRLSCEAQHKCSPPQIADIMKSKNHSRPTPHLLASSRELLAARCCMP